MDDREPIPIQPRHATISQHCDRGGVDAGRAAPSIRPAGRAQADRQCPRSAQWPHGWVEYRVLVARYPAGPAAEKENLAFLWVMARGQYAQADSGGTLGEASGAKETERQPERRHHRQSEGEKRRTRRTRIDPRGLMRTNGSKGRSATC